MKKPIWKRWYAIIAYIVVGFALIGALFPTEESDPVAELPVATEAPKTPEKTPEPVDTSSGVESHPNYRSYESLQNAASETGFNLIPVDTGNPCLDAALSADESFGVLVFSCQYDSMEVALASFERHAAAAFPYRVTSANWALYFQDKSMAEDFAEGFGNGTKMEEI